MLQFKHKKNEKNVQIVQREVRMKKLLYRPKDAWVGDLIPYYENGTFYGYYLHDPRIRDKEYAEETHLHFQRVLRWKIFLRFYQMVKSVCICGIV